MAFPTKDYFSLNEVCARWHRKMTDVEYCIETGLLNAHIKVCSVRLATISDDDNFSEYEFTGCKRLSPDDCHILFRHSKRAIVEFLKENGDIKEKLIRPQRIIVTKVDLMIFLKDLLEFETKYNLHYEETDLPLWDNNNKPEPMTNIAIPNDCDIFYIGDNAYTFGPIQANIIRELHRAAMTSQPWLLGKNLLADSGAKTQHLKDLFRMHPILPRIKYRAKGYYSLSLEKLSTNN